MKLEVGTGWNWRKVSGVMNRGRGLKSSLRSSTWGEAEIGKLVGLQKQSREKEASQVGTRRSCTWRLGGNLWFLTNRRPLVALVGVVSGEWRHRSKTKVSQEGPGKQEWRKQGLSH